MKAVSLISTLLAGAALFVAVPASYARDEAPKAEIAMAQQAIEQAQSAGATESAPLELKTARDKLQTAQGLVAKDKRKDFPQARRMAEEAVADAQLAQARATAERARKSLDEVNQSIRAMRDETQRQSS